MKKVIIEDEMSAVKYIEMVLNEWDSWRDHHIYLVQALQILLKANKSKNETLISTCEMLTDMRDYINALHRHIETLERGLK